MSNGGAAAHAAYGSGARSSAALFDQESSPEPVPEPDRNGRHESGEAHKGDEPNRSPAVAVLTRSRPDSDLRKRCIDLFGAAALFILFAPLMAAIYVIVRLDGGPGIFAHERIGKNGARFKCYKFRSMVPNAERVLKDILVCNEQFRKDWHADQKLRNDPRITPIGAFLRRKSLDELPQLVNVLRGEMSLVGPRPITADEIGRYGADIAFYYQTRPGLTGAWQVSGRNDVSYADRVALDVDYTKNWSLLNDFRILLKTVWVVAKGEGAL